jgi:phage/conjugal plasmid C-4 type zinc finger TraR family protein
MDQFDHASELESYHRNRVISEVRARLRKAERLPSRRNCIDCGEQIPELRRTKVQGCIRCIFCQSLFEEGD